MNHPNPTDKKGTGVTLHSNETSSLQQPDMRPCKRTSSRRQGATSGVIRRSRLEEQRQLPGRRSSGAELRQQPHTPNVGAVAEAMADIDFTGTFTVREVAEILQITPDKVYGLIHAGSLPYVQVGRQFRLGKFSFWAYINGLQSAELVEQIMHSFVRQHCCRADQCEKA